MVGVDAGHGWSSSVNGSNLGDGRCSGYDRGGMIGSVDPGYSRRSVDRGYLGNGWSGLDCRHLSDSRSRVVSVDLGDSGGRSGSHDWSSSNAGDSWGSVVGVHFSDGCGWGGSNSGNCWSSVIRDRWSGCNYGTKGWGGVVGQGGWSGHISEPKACWDDRVAQSPGNKGQDEAGTELDRDC
ncbi:hypothetical protein MTO96_018257 [Rhipicephalus appendiculatus]